MNNSKNSRAEALVSGHPWDAKKVSVTEAGHIQKCKNTEFLWEFRKWGFMKVDICMAVQLQKCPLGEFPLSFILNKTKSPKRSATDFMTKGPFSLKTSHM